jgi:glycosyltransferase involved in cell wall biosynthesis
MIEVDLIWLADASPAPGWDAGHVVTVRPLVDALVPALREHLPNSNASAILFWDASHALPDSGFLEQLLASPLDCWHGGLKLGTGGLPQILDFISPTWMLACDPPPDIEATSWRLSLKACLVRAEVLRKLGGLHPGFQTLAVAALEMGHRWIRNGALMRHVPRLLGSTDIQPPTLNPHASQVSSQWSVVGGHESAIPFADELRFAYYRFGRKWAAWALFRALMTRYTDLSTAVRTWRSVMYAPRPQEPAPLRQWSVVSSQWSVVSRQSSVVSGRPQVSVLIPTVDRYPYLRTLLAQLRSQTMPPLEVIIVDQTTPQRRDPRLREEFADLPLQVIYQDEPGQCTSRNAGLEAARGDYVLFIDDDDEVPSDLIESHLHTLARFQAEVSSGVADEVGAGSLPPDFCLLRASDVFPTNNSMIRKEVLLQSGLFDLAYNRRSRADGDLGMRIYLAGGTMVLNPSICVLHHHAPSGGLRQHKARATTYALSRNKVSVRTVASASELYLAQRYFPKTHLREMLWQSLVGTFSIRGGFAKKMAKILVGTFLLPQSLLRLRGHTRQAADMTRAFPRIPRLGTGHIAEQRQELCVI